MAIIPLWTTDPFVVGIGGSVSVPVKVISVF